MNKVEIQLERLRRHWNLASKTYDYVSLLELSHTLRIWVDLKPALPKLYPNLDKSKIFNTATPNKKFSRSLGKFQYIMTYMPGSRVRTFASNGDVVSAPSLDPQKAAFMMKNGDTKKNEILSNFVYVGGVVTEEQRRLFDSEKIKRCTYVDWMASEMVRLNYLRPDAQKLCKITLSRELLINRMANSFDGSHPSVVKDEDFQNIFDEHIRHLMRFRIGGLPLPYFLLLKIATDIIEKIPSEINASNQSVHLDSGSIWDC